MADRVVLDTNVFVSALLFRSSVCHQILKLAMQRKIQWVASLPVLHENVNQLYLVLHKRTEPTPSDISKLLGTWTGMVTAVERIEPAVEHKVVQDDPEDDKFMTVAIEGNAPLVVSSDQHLLQLDSKLKTIDGQAIRVMKPGAALRHLQPSNRSRLSPPVKKAKRSR